MKYRLGVDLGGTNIAVGLVNENCELVKKESVPTGATRPGEEIVRDMAALCRKVCEDASVAWDDVVSVGIASPGIVVVETGVVAYANNLPFVGFPIGPMLSEMLGGIAVCVANDANAAALGEAVAGAAKGSANSMMVTLGTGVGGGVIINHKVYSGFNGAASEPGHTVIVVDGQPCTCGRRGCWEAYSSATALIRMTKEKLAECETSGRATKMTKFVADAGKVSGRTAFQGYRAGDEAASEVVNAYVKYLACGIANMINLFQPEVLCIGGGISGEGQLLVDLLSEYASEGQYGFDHIRHTEIRIAKLGNDAGIIGAAMLEK